MKIMTQDSGVNLSIYCCWVLFFLAGTCVFWMDAGKPIRWFLHRSCLSVDDHVHFGDGKISTSQKPCRNSERHNHHNVDIRYTKFYMSIYFIFYGGEGCTNWDVTWAKPQVFLSCHHFRAQHKTYETPQTFNAFHLKYPIGEQLF